MKVVQCGERQASFQPAMWRDKTLPSLAQIFDPVSFTFQIEEAFERLPGFKTAQVMEFRYILSSEKKLVHLIWVVSSYLKQQQQQQQWKLCLEAFIQCLSFFCAGLRRTWSGRFLFLLQHFHLFIFKNTVSKTCIF